MTALLNEDSAPAHCGIVVYPLDTLARLLHLPPGVRVDAITKRQDGVEVVISGDEASKLPRVEPGYPIPLVQLVALCDERGRVQSTAILPIDADIGALNAGASEAEAQRMGAVG